MSARQALISSMHIFILLALVLAGCFFTALPFLPEVQIQLLQHSTLIGLVLFLTTALLFIGFFGTDRGKFLVIRMGVSLDVHILRKAIDDCLEKHFEKRISLSDVAIKKKSKIEIEVVLNQEDKSARKLLLQEVERELVILLRERFDYLKPFHLIAKVS